MSSPAQPPRSGRSSRPPRRPPGTASAGTPRVPTPEGETTAARKRPRWVIFAVGLLIVVVAGVAVWGVLVMRGGQSPAHTVAVPSPTPSISPVARGADTTFAKALPSSVLQYALVSSVDDTEWVASGALEAYVEEFDSGSATLTLRVGQWETSTEADDMFSELTAAAPPDETSEPVPSPTEGLPRFGAVEVDGATVGNYVIIDNGDGSGTVTWYNTTAVLQLSGQIDEVTRAYSAFPM